MSCYSLSLFFSKDHDHHLLLLLSMSLHPRLSPQSGFWYYRYIPNNCSAHCQNVVYSQLDPTCMLHPNPLSAKHFHCSQYPLKLFDLSKTLYYSYLTPYSYRLLLFLTLWSSHLSILILRTLLGRFHLLYHSHMRYHIRRLLKHHFQL